MKVKKILIIAASVIVAAAILFTAVIHPIVSNVAHKTISAENPPAVVADFSEKYPKYSLGFR